MPARIESILLSAILLLPLTILGQTAPTEVEQAVRARVTEFLQLHVDANFRKAYEMVAEDTKDEYFGSGKAQLKGFTIDNIKLTDNFTKATVTGTISKMFNVAGQDMPVTMPSTTTWKIENGKWVWYNDLKATWLTPMGPSTISPAGPTPAITATDDGGLPKDFNDKTIAAAARSILQQVSVDKKEITLAADKPSEGRVVFHNGMTGSVQLEVSMPDIPGFTAKAEQSVAKAGGDVPVVFRYNPSDPAGRTDPITVMLTVQPVNQLFLIQVKFAK